MQGQLLGRFALRRSIGIASSARWFHWIGVFSIGIQDRVISKVDSEAVHALPAIHPWKAYMHFDPIKGDTYEARCEHQHRIIEKRQIGRD